jgi:hypothetical protein
MDCKISILQRTRRRWSKHPARLTAINEISTCAGDFFGAFQAASFQRQHCLHHCRMKSHPAFRFRSNSRAAESLK